jgi:two-component system LytT family response regulator
MAARQYELLMESMKGQNQQNQRIAIPTKSGLLILDVNSITRCEAGGSYTTVYTKDSAPILTTRGVKEFEDILSDQDFFRTHHSHLVNLRYLKEYIRGDGGFVIMEDGTQVDVSRRKRDSFLERLKKV